jgi:MFS family permease
LTQAPDRSSTAAGEYADNRIDYGRRFRVLPAVMVVQLTTVIATTVVAAAGPRIASDLGGLGLYPWIFSGYTLATAAAGPVVGKVSDLVGRRHFYILGTALFFLGSIGGALAQDMPQMIAARAVAGLGGGAMSALTGLTVGDLFPPRQRARWLAATVGVYGAGSLAGPSLGGLVTDLSSWRWIFVGAVVAPVAATLLIIPVLPAGRKLKGVSLDVAGLGLFLVAVTALLIGITWADEDNGWTTREVAAGTVTAVATALLLVQESRSKSPFISVAMFRRAAFTYSIAISFTLGVIFFAMIGYVPIYVQVVVGEGAAASGALLIPMMAPFVLGGIGAGQLMARSGRYKALVRIGCLLVFAGASCLALAEITGSRPLLEIGLGLSGLGAGGVFPILSLVVQSVFPYRNMGAAHSLRQLFTSLAPAIGIPLMGIFVFHGRHLTTLQISASVRASLAQGLQELFIAMAVLAVVTLGLALLLPGIKLRSTFDEEL